MNMMNDLELLDEYAARDSEAAFTTLVQRHVGLVYSAALRQVRNPHLAEEVAQAVFIILARKARNMRPGTSLSGWLYRTARFAACDALKSQYRRQRREQEAAQMETSSAEEPAWVQVAPFLDEAMAGLGEKDRNAVLLRFFENKSLDEVGFALGVSPDSARMRVGRALEKLRVFLTRRGAVLSAAAIAGLLSANAVQAAPAGLAGSVAAGALLKGAAGAASTLAMVKGTIKAMTWIKLKMAAAGAAIALAAATVAIMAGNRQPSGPPDPVDLLKKVAQARQKIRSGEMEFDLPRSGTNHMRIKAVFDGERRRFESWEREYSYVMTGPDPSQSTDAKMKELGLDQEAAVQAGLLTGFESHHVTAYDGSALLDYWGANGQTDIKDPAKGSPSFVFDPRILGLTPALAPRSTIESCLAYGDAKSVKLLGRETVDGIAAWHVRVLDKWNMNCDFWIDAGHPSHVVKSQYNGDTMSSKFDPAQPKDPIPIDVLYVRDAKTYQFELHFLRLNARYNVRVDPASWTLAGLNMPTGTAVADDRSMRRIGYWNGTGLSENPPPASRQTGKAQPPPNPRTLLTLAEKDPKSPFALEAATWVLLNTPDGPEVETATGIILQNHVGNTNLAYLCQEMLNLRHRSAGKLLRTVLENNPSPEVRANACFALAILLKDQSNDEGDEQAAEEAERLFELLIGSYGQVETGGKKLADRAEPELLELRRLGVGREAPEIQGEDMDGRPLKLSDYRGKVVVLIFWGTWCGPCMAMVPEERQLAERLAGKPFALLGVNSDKDAAKVKEAAAGEKMTWPSFRDGAPRGPIATAWNVHSWPAVYVLDTKGVVRYRDVRGQDLANAADKLLGLSPLPAR
jgi:RNA polymerase sigma factor (sigma-70 family)